MMNTVGILDTSPYLIALPIAAVIAIVVAAVAAFFVVRSYSMKHKPVDYPLNEFTKLELQEQSDRFAGSHVTSRVISDERRGGRR